jgi:hypothetical protein
MKLEAFLLALKVAEARRLGGGYRRLTEDGTLVIADAWDAISLLWAWLDTDKPMLFSEADLRQELGCYPLNDDQTIAYIDTCEVEYMLSGSCPHIRAEGIVDKSDDAALAQT